MSCCAPGAEAALEISLAGRLSSPPAFRLSFGELALDLGDQPVILGQAKHKLRH